MENKLMRLPFGMFIGKESSIVPESVIRAAVKDVPKPADPTSLGGRKSTESIDTWYNTNVWDFFSRRKQNSKLGMASSFDLDDFSKMDFDVLADLLTDLSPEISKALWDFLLMANGGYKIKALNVTGDTQAVNEQAQIALGDIMTTLGMHNGTITVFFDRLYRTLFLRGSILAELVLAPNGRDFVDIAVPDTATLTYRRRFDSLRGQIWEFGQRINGVFVSLDIPTVRYVPLHPSPNSIEGHSMCSAAFFCAIFLMSVLRDTKRVVQHQGYMRLDVEIQFERLLQTMPEDLQGNPEAVNQWMKSVVTSVEHVYQNLKPDDTYIHSDAIKVNKPVGTANADSLSAIGSLFDALERMLTRAVKSMPILMGGGASGSKNETHANREWEIYAKGIETVQHLIETPLEYLLQMALQAQGIQAKVELRFHLFRAAELVRDTQVDMLKSQVARANFDNGYISQNEASLYAVDKDRADSPEPRNAVPPKVGGQADTQLSGAQDNPNPNEARSPTPSFLGSVENFISKYDTGNTKAFLDATVIDEDEGS